MDREDVRVNEARPRRVIRRGAVSVSAAEESTPKRQLPWRTMLHRVLFIGGVAALVWVVFFSGWLSVRGVSIDKNQPLSKATLEEDLKNYLKERPTQRNVLFLQPDTFEEYLQDKHPTLRKVNINRTLLLEVHVQMQESEPAMIWQSGASSWLIGDDGRVLRVAKEEDMKYGKVVDTVQLEPKIGDRVADREFARFVSELYRESAAKNISVVQVEIGETTQEVIVRLIDGTYIRMATTRGAGEQLAAYEATKVTAKSSGKAVVEYVDVRVVGKTYYK